MYSGKVLAVVFLDCSKIPHRVTIDRDFAIEL